MRLLNPGARAEKKGRSRARSRPPSPPSRPSKRGLHPKSKVENVRGRSNSPRKTSKQPKNAKVTRANKTTPHSTIQTRGEKSTARNVQGGAHSAARDPVPTSIERVHNDASSYQSGRTTTASRSMRSTTSKRSASSLKSSSLIRNVSLVDDVFEVGGTTILMPSRGKMQRRNSTIIRPTNSQITSSSSSSERVNSNTNILSTGSVTSSSNGMERGRSPVQPNNVQQALAATGSMAASGPTPFVRTNSQMTSASRRCLSPSAILSRDIERGLAPAQRSNSQMRPSVLSRSPSPPQPTTIPRGRSTSLPPPTASQRGTDRSTTSLTSTIRVSRSRSVSSHNTRRSSATTRDRTMSPLTRRTLPANENRSPKNNKRAVPRTGQFNRHRSTGPDSSKASTTWIGRLFSRSRHQARHPLPSRRSTSRGSVSPQKKNGQQKPNSKGTRKPSAEIETMTRTTAVAPRTPITAAVAQSGGFSRTGIPQVTSPRPGKAPFSTRLGPNHKLPPRNAGEIAMRQNVSSNIQSIRSGPTNAPSTILPRNAPQFESSTQFESSSSSSTIVQKRFQGNIPMDCLSTCENACDYVGAQVGECIEVAMKSKDGRFAVGIKMLLREENQQEERGNTRKIGGGCTTHVHSASNHAALATATTNIRESLVASLQQLKTKLANGSSVPSLETPPQAVSQGQAGSSPVGTLLPPFQVASSTTKWNTEASKRSSRGTMPSGPNLQRRIQSYDPLSPSRHMVKDESSRGGGSRRTDEKIASAPLLNRRFSSFGQYKRGGFSKIAPVVSGNPLPCSKMSALGIHAKRERMTVFAPDQQVERHGLNASTTFP
jgi:hypothetical protein